MPSSRPVVLAKARRMMILLAYDAEGRKNQNIDFRMAEEPEKLLEQQRIVAPFRAKIGSSKITRLMSDDAPYRRHSILHDVARA